MVSSTCSVESAWPASFFRDLRLHSFNTSKLATSRILQRDWGEEGNEETKIRKCGFRFLQSKTTLNADPELEPLRGTLAQQGGWVIQAQPRHAGLMP